MKKALFLLLSALVLTSCSMTNFLKENSYTKGHLDLTSGKWLLYKIDASKEYHYDYELKALEDFTEIFGSRFTYFPRVSNMGFPMQLSLPVSKEILQLLKTTTQQDYLILMRAKQVSNDLGSVGLSNSMRQFDMQETNESYFGMVVYDLNTLEEVYNQKITGTAGRNIDNNKVNFSNSSKTILNKTYKRLIKDFKNTSYYK